VDRYHFEPPGDIMNIEEIIQVPYTTRPKMQKNTGFVFNPNPSVKYLSEKTKQLAMFGYDLYGMNIKAITNQLIRRAESMTGKTITGDIIDFALNFEEDVAIMNDGILSAICFCFPSSWIPFKALNKSLMQIHHPVADGEHLRKVSDKLAQTIADPVLGSFERHVWTITRVPELSNHPEIKEQYKDVPATLENLYFRHERQTTLPLNDCRTSLFFVKINVVPLVNLWYNNSQLIKESINSMSGEIIRYKNLEEIKTVLSSMD
jgi:hypothetical protein